MVADMSKDAPEAPEQLLAQATAARATTPGTRFDHQLLRDWGYAIFAAAGSSQAEAVIVTDHLVNANLKGHDSHGVVRISKYLDWVRKKELLTNQHVRTVTSKGSILVLDGGFGYGQVIGQEAMKLVIERTREHGFCAAAIRNSGHLGRIGEWPEQLARAGLTSVHFVNTSGYGILVAPHGGSDRRLSANPVAAGCPGPGGNPYILDIATSAVAEGKIQVARNQGSLLEPGLIMDGQGEPTNDPERFYADPVGSIFPMASHKGSGISFFCEILAGSLSGGQSSHPNNPTAWRLVNNMMTICFDPAVFSEFDFSGDVQRLAEWVKGSPARVPGIEVLLPGELETRTELDRRENGIFIDTQTHRQLLDAATSWGLQIPSELAL